MARNRKDDARLAENSRRIGEERRIADAGIVADDLIGEICAVRRENDADECQRQPMFFHDRSFYFRHMPVCRSRSHGLRLRDQCESGDSLDR